MTRLAHPAWAFVPGLASVAFPWRLSLFLTLAAAVLVGTTLVDLWHRRRSRAVLPAVVLLALSFPLAGALTYSSAGAADWQTFSPRHARRPVVRLRTTGALMPRSNPRMRAFWTHEPAGPPTVATPEGKLAGTAKSVLEQNHLRSLQVDVSEPMALLDVATFDYPGWQAYLDGAPTPHTRSPELGTLRLAVPRGRHHVEWVFEATPLRRVAAAVSGLSVAVLLALTLYPPGRTMPRRRAA